MNIKTATPVQIDTELATLNQVMKRQEAKLFNFRILASKGYDVDQAKVALAEAILEETTASMLPLLQEYTDRGGWTRAYLVNNSNGHVHNTTACSTCYISTDFYWLTQVSGADEAEIVEQAGDKACTVCFPSAPVLPSFRKVCQFETPEGAKAREERDARDAVKAEKAAKTAAKAITNPDGSALRDEWGIIRTEASAWQRVVENITNTQAYGYSPKLTENDRIIKALAAKLQITEGDVQAKIATKVAAKIKRDAR